jgi:predicted PurR-regulated permease PerM|tara:strand:- start:174 stop:428 length:255 start_codon:yes stop_codon:yes gene_type:complete
MNHAMSLLVAIVLALGAWSLSRTFTISTDLVVSQEKVNKLERQVDKLMTQMEDVKDKEKEIMDQHMDIFKLLQQGKTVPKGYQY